ncbi:hypothetical protein Lepto7375DRAFT_4770 [Leptolyngbya sp. PCC 7375]|nr:hypothetical protein Lepto7375DRAFT_4770 [Leptolyngbya sp. PCC 7375]
MIFCCAEDYGCQMDFLYILREKHKQMSFLEQDMKASDRFDARFRHKQYFQSWLKEHLGS